MAVTRAQKVRLGVFVATGLTALVGGLILLAGMKLGETRDSYTVRFEQGAISLSGLDVGSPVKYSGIRVGRVESIRVDEKDVSTIVVTLTLDGGTPVADNSVASLGSLGITGLKYIELSRGEKGARIREPGEEIPSGPSLMDELTDQASDIARKLNHLIEQLNTFTSPSNQAKVTEILDRTNRLLETTEATVSENRGNLQLVSKRVAELSTELEGASKELRQTVRQANELLRTTQPKVHGLADEATALVTELRTTRAKVDLVLETSQSTLEQAQTTVGPDGLGKTLASVDQLVTRGYLVLLQSQEDITESAGHLKETAENMRIFSERIKEDPSLLLLGGDEGEVGP